MLLSRLPFGVKAAPDSLCIMKSCIKGQALSRNGYEPLIWDHKVMGLSFACTVIVFKYDIYALSSLPLPWQISRLILIRCQICKWGVGNAAAGGGCTCVSATHSSSRWAKNWSLNWSLISTWFHSFFLITKCTYDLTTQLASNTASSHCVGGLNDF